MFKIIKVLSVFLIKQKKAERFKQSLSLIIFLEILFITNFVGNIHKSCGTNDLCRLLLHYVRALDR